MHNKDVTQKKVRKERQASADGLSSLTVESATLRASGDGEEPSYARQASRLESLRTGIPHALIRIFNGYELTVRHDRGWMVDVEKSTKHETRPSWLLSSGPAVMTGRRSNLDRFPDRYHPLRSPSVLHNQVVYGKQASLCPLNLMAVHDNVAAAHDQQCNAM